MPASLFIARRIVFNRQPSFSRFIIRLAAGATALSVAAIIITLSLINGFQYQVAQKVYSFWGHIRVHELQAARSSVSEETPLRLSDSIDQIIKSQGDISHFHRFATKSVVLKTGSGFEGVLLKGVDENFNKGSFSTSFLKTGQALDFSDTSYSNGILISDKLSEILGLKVGSKLSILFIRQGDDMRTRPVVIRGIYHTGIQDYDNQFVLCDLRLLQRISLWQNDEAAGYEVFLNDPQDAVSVADTLYRRLPQGMAASALTRLYPNIFDWLAIQDQTKRVVIGVMLAVAIVNLLTCLLILVMERTKMIAVLSAMGMPLRKISSIFWYYAATIAGAGILIGLAFSFLILGLQYFTGFIKLDEETYYVRTLPVMIKGWEISLVVIITFLVCIAALRLPLWYVGRLPVIKALKFN